MPVIPLECPSCGSNLNIDSNENAAICNYCGKPFVVKDAIVQNYINNVVNISADSINIISQKDFVIEGGTLKKYQGEAVEVHIPRNVISISEKAFYGLMITSLVIPEGVEIINLENCPRLISVNIPSSANYIHIKDCKKLVDISWPEALTSNDIGLWINNCPSITSIELPKGINSLGWHTFEGCTKLEKLHLADVSSISSLTFDGRPSINNITINCQGCGTRLQLKDLYSKYSCPKCSGTFELKRI